MNIKEEFKDILNFTEISGSCDIIEKCENISDNYALSFVNWIVEFQKIKGIIFTKSFDTKELLNLFKNNLINERPKAKS